MLRLYLLIVLLGFFEVYSQNQDRNAATSVVTSINYLPADVMVLDLASKLEASLKAVATSPQDKIDDLLFTKTEFDEIYKQTYNVNVVLAHNSAFDKKKHEIKQNLENFRNSNVLVQFQKMYERRGDGNLRSMVANFKITINNNIANINLVLIKYNQTYKIIMIDL